MKPVMAKDSKLAQHFSSTRGLDEKVIIAWKDINYSTLVKDASKSKFMKKVYKEKPILKGVSGEAESGQLLAIMGPTGCGKTSLLNILASRCPDNSQNLVKCTGSILVNNIRRDDEKFRRISAYVLQDDHLYPHLTVFETFNLAANFYLSDTMTETNRVELVDAVISELGLNKCRDSIIGDEKLRGISGGERRRASIGVQLISDPAVLFLDEPTSGLDSFQALSVMESMKAMALNGRLVISVIHQPRSSIFNMFDKLLLLSEGRSAYFGDCLQAVDYFNSLHYVCPESFNPSDYYLDILSPDNRSPESEEDSNNRIQSILNTWSQHPRNHTKSIMNAPSSSSSSMVKSNSISDFLSNQFSRTNNNTDTNTNTAINNDTNLDANTNTTNNTNHQQQQPQHPSMQSNMSNINDIKTIGSNQTSLEKRFRIMKLLAWRAFTEQSRDIATITFKLMFTLIFSLIIGGIYSHIGHDQRSIQNRFGILFFIVINQIFSSVIAVFNSFPKEANIVNRERSSHAYDTFSYYISKIIVEIPINVMPSIIYSCILYYMVELNPALNPSRFGLFILILMYVNTVGITLGIAVSAGAKSVDMANAVGMPILIISILFGGYYIKITSLPIVLNWFTYLSLLRWGFEALCINEFQGLTFTCGNVSPSNCLSTGEAALASLSFDNHNVGYPIFGLSMLFIGFLLVGYVVLERSKVHYLKFGHVGKMIKKFHQTNSNSSNELYVSGAAAAIDVDVVSNLESSSSVAVMKQVNEDDDDGDDDKAAGENKDNGNSNSDNKNHHHHITTV